jgi:excisionase family DNA binding protein
MRRAHETDPGPAAALNGRAAAPAVPPDGAAACLAGPRAAALQPLLLTLEQAAALLALSVRTLKRMVRDGAVPGICRPFGRAVRLHRPTLERWLEEGCPRVYARGRGGRR